MARATIDLLPGEDLVYLGDTGRYPYGSKPLDDVREHAIEIANHLVDKFDIKVLVVACNTATAAALKDLRADLSIDVLGVIKPGVRAVVERTDSKRIGVIGTVGTVSSGAYESALAALDDHIEIVTCACPGLVEFVERGETTGERIQILVERLLAPIVEADVDVLLLGCTHYPYLARAISDAVGPEVILVSSADETAFELARLLESKGLGTPDENTAGSARFISSGDIASFTRVGSRLLGPELVDAEHWRPKYAP